MEGARMERFAALVTRRPLVNILVIAGLTLLLGWQTTYLTIDTDAKNMMPKDDPVLTFEDEVAATFGVRENSVTIGVVADDIFTPTTLAKVQRIVNEVKALTGVIESRVAGLPTVEEITSSDEGLEILPLWQVTPTTVEEAQRLKKTVLANKLLAGSLVSRDGTATAIHAEFEDGVDASLIYHQLRAIVSREEGPERIYLAGTPIATAVFRTYAQKVGVLLPFAILAIMVVLFWSFRSIRGVIIPLTTAVLSSVWMLGLRGLLRIPLDTFSTVLPILIMAIGSGHSVQVMKRYYELVAEGHEKSAAVRGAVAKAGLAMITAGLTSAAGFGSLATFSLRSIQYFGIFAAVGILSVLVLELAFIPAWQMLLPIPRKKPATAKGRGKALDRALSSVGKRFTHKPIVTLAGVLVVFALALGGATFLQVEGNMTSMLTPESDLRVAERVFAEKFGGSSVLYVIVQGAGPDAMKDPAVLAYIDDLESYARTVPGIGNAISIADYMKQLNQVMNDDMPAFYRIPRTRELAAQYLLVYAMSGDARSLNRVVDSSYQAANVTLTLSENSTAKTSKIMDAIKGYMAARPFPGLTVRYAGISVVYQRVNDIIVNEKILNILQSAGVIFLICMAIFRSLVGGIFAILPLSLSVVLNFGVMGWFGIPLELSTATISGMAIGIGSDYAIYYLLRHKQEFRAMRDAGQVDGGAGAPGETHGLAAQTTMVTTGRAIITTALAIAVGYLTLTFSDFGGHRTLGFLVAFSMVTSSVSALVILPSALALFKPKFILRDQRPRRELPAQRVHL